MKTSIMKTYQIGDTVVLLDEIAAIESEHRTNANAVYVPVLFKNGAKVVATIKSNGGDERADSNSPYRGKFMERFEREIEDFRKTWQDYILNYQTV